MANAGINPDVIAIKGAYVTNDEDLFDRFPRSACLDMDDMTEAAQDATYN